MVSPTSLAEPAAPSSLALGLFPPGQALSAPFMGHEGAGDPLRPRAGEPRDLLGTISSSVLKSTAVGPAEKSSLWSLSRSGILKARSSWSLERDRGEGCVWRTEDLFFLMGEAGVTTGVGIPDGPSGFFGSGAGPLLLASTRFCRESVSIVLDGDLVIWGMRVVASLWLSLQELRLRLRDLAVGSPRWLRLPEATLPDDRRPMGGLELTDKNGEAPDLPTGRSELARFSKDLILCFTEKNEVDSWGQFCSE